MSAHYKEEKAGFCTSYKSLAIIEGLSEETIRQT